jgi:diguanylate cyclase (GGDEF)-like protein
MREELERLQAELEQERARSAQFKHEAATDVLTGLSNRRRGMERLAQLASERRSGVERRTTVAAFALLMVDVDFFKKVNDIYGHAAGDRVLAAIAHIMRGTCRSTDTLVRWGGEEFLVICPSTPSDRALALAERIRGAIARRDWMTAHNLPLNVTASIGVSQPAHMRETCDAVIQRADDALYAAKEHGRNCVIQLFGNVA